MTGRLRAVRVLLQGRWTATLSLSVANAQGRLLGTTVQTISSFSANDGSTYNFPFADIGMDLRVSTSGRYFLALQQLSGEAANVCYNTSLETFGCQLEVNVYALYIGPVLKLRSQQTLCNPLPDPPAIYPAAQTFIGTTTGYLSSISVSFLNADVGPSCFTLLLYAVNRTASTAELELTLLASAPAVGALVTTYEVQAIRFAFNQLMHDISAPDRQSPFVVRGVEYMWTVSPTCSADSDTNGEWNAGICRVGCWGSYPAAEANVLLGVVWHDDEESNDGLSYDWDLVEFSGEQPAQVLWHAPGCTTDMIAVTFMYKWASASTIPNVTAVQVTLNDRPATLWLEGATAATELRPSPPLVFNATEAGLPLSNVSITGVAHLQLKKLVVSAGRCRQQAVTVGSSAAQQVTVFVDFPISWWPQSCNASCWGPLSGSTTSSDTPAVYNVSYEQGSLIVERTDCQSCGWTTALSIPVTVCSLESTCGPDAAPANDSFCEGTWRSANGNSRWTYHNGTGNEQAAYLTMNTSGSPGPDGVLYSPEGQYSNLKFTYFLQGTGLAELRVEARFASAAGQLWSRVWYSLGSDAWNATTVPFELVASQVRFAVYPAVGITTSVGLQQLLLRDAADQYPLGQGYVLDDNGEAPRPAANYIDLISQVNFSTCYGPINLTATSPSTVFDTCTSDSAVQITCGGQGLYSAPDLVFYADVLPQQSVAVWVTGASKGVRTELRWGGECPGQYLRYCADDIDYRHVWANPTTTTQRLYLIVELYPNTCGTFSLAWELGTVQSWLLVAGTAQTYINGALQGPPASLVTASDGSSLALYVFPSVALGASATLDIAVQCTVPTCCGVLGQFRAPLTAAGFAATSTQWQVNTSGTSAWPNASQGCAHTVSGLALSPVSGAGWIWAGNASTGPSGTVWLHFDLTTGVCTNPNCPSKQCQVPLQACEANASQCMYQSVPDGTACSAGRYFHYDVQFHPVAHNDTCAQGRCVAGPDLWTASDGMCSDERGEHLPYAYQWDVDEAGCREYCATSQYCTAVTTRGRFCALHFTLDGNVLLPTLPAGFVWFGLDSGEVIGAVETPWEASYCEIYFSRMPRLLWQDDWSGVVDALWGALGHRYLVRMRTSDNPPDIVPSVKLGFIPMFQQPSEQFSAMTAGSMSPAPGSPQSVALLEAYANTSLLWFYSSQWVYELVGVGRCVGAFALAAVRNLTLPGGCRTVCSGDPSCVAYSVSVGGTSTLLCYLYSTAAGPVAQSTGEDGFVCQVKVPVSGFQPLGPGACVGGSALPKSLLYVGMDFNTCQTACTDRPSCLGFTTTDLEYSPSSSASARCYLHYSGTMSPVAGWTLSDSLLGAEAITHFASWPGLPDAWCYAGLNRSRPTSHSLQYAGSSQPCNVTLTATLASTAAVSAAQCHAVCAVSRRCQGWRYVPASCSGSLASACLIDSPSGPDWLPGSLGFAAAATPTTVSLPAGCCLAQAVSYPADSTASTLTKALVDSCGPIVENVAIPALYATGYGNKSGPTRLQYTVNGHLVTMQGIVEPLVTGAGYPAGTQLASIPAAYAPATRVAGTLTARTGYVYNVTLLPNGSLVAGPAGVQSAPRTSSTVSLPAFVPAACLLHRWGRVMGLTVSASLQYAVVLTYWALADVQAYRAVLLRVATGEQVGNWSLAPWTSFQDPRPALDGTGGNDISRVVAQFSSNSALLYLRQTDTVWNAYQTSDGVPALQNIVCDQPTLFVSAGLACMYSAFSFVALPVANPNPPPTMALYYILKFNLAIKVAAFSPNGWYTVVWLPDRINVYDGVRSTSTDLAGSGQQLVAAAWSPDSVWLGLVMQEPGNPGLAIAVYRPDLGYLQNADWEGFRQWNGQSVPLLAWGVQPLQLLLYNSTDGLLLTIGVDANTSWAWERIRWSFPVHRIRLNPYDPTYALAQSATKVGVYSFVPATRQPGLCSARVPQDDGAATPQVPAHYIQTGVTEAACLALCRSSVRCTAVQYTPNTSVCLRFGLMPEVQHMDYVGPTKLYDAPRGGDGQTGWRCSVKRSPTATATPTPTATALAPSPQPTSPNIPLCGSWDGPRPQQVALALTWSPGVADSQCEQPLQAPEASAFRAPRFYLQILRLDSGQLRLQVVGCTAQAKGCPDCSDCVRYYTPGSVGLAEEVPASVSSTLRLLYTPNTTGSARTFAAAHFEGQLLAVAWPTPLFCLLLTLGTAAVALFCAAVAGLCARRRAALRRYRHRPGNSRLRLPLLQASLVFAVGLVLCGFVWLAVGLGDLHFPGPVPPLLPAGIVTVVVAGVAALLLLWWAMLDPEAHVCPGCSAPVGRLRFQGRYSIQGRRALKFHDACARCVHCRKFVDRDFWPASPVGRPYHANCWEVSCEIALRQPNRVAQFGHAPFTDVEAAHLLAAAIRQAAAEPMERLLQLRPHLHRVPISGMLPAASVISVAARCGNLRALQALLARPEVPLEPQPQPHPDGAYSLYLPAPGDVFVHQPLLRYNDRPVYVGHTTGQYVYYHLPAPGGDRLPEGWWRAEFLGSVFPLQQLHLPPLPTSAGPGQRSGDSDDGDPESPVTGEADAALAGSGSFAPGWLQASQAMRWLRPPANGLLPSTPNSNVPFDSPLNPLQPTAAGGANHVDREQPLSGYVPAAAPNAVAYIPHGLSVLEEAAASGSEEVLRFVMATFRLHHPRCFLWQYRDTSGLWADLPAGLQDQIAAATEQRRERVEVHFRAATVAIELPTSKLPPVVAQDEKVRWLLRPVFQYRVSSAGEWRLTSDQDAIPPLAEVYLLAHPSTLAAAAQHTAIPALLEAHMVDPSLWAPPCRKADSLALCARSISQAELLRGALHRMLRPILGIHTESYRLACAMWLLVDENNQALGLGHHQPAHARPHQPHVRLADGLLEPAVGPAPGVGGDHSGAALEGQVLPFCLRLSENPHGYTFAAAAITDMCGDAVLKWEELRRQQTSLPPANAAAVYAYLYDLPADGHQIHSSINAAMRANDAAALAFWQPLLRPVDRALSILPPVRGKVYRVLDPTQHEVPYHTSQMVCWPAFSVATFRWPPPPTAPRGPPAKVVVQSASARDVHRLAACPDLGEVLFRPGATFEVTSVLPAPASHPHGPAAGPQLVLTEVGLPAGSPGQPLEVSSVSANILVQVPRGIASAVLARFQANAPIDVARVEFVEPQEEGERGLMAVVVMGAAETTAATGAGLRLPQPMAGKFSAASVGLRRTPSPADPAVPAAGHPEAGSAAPQWDLFGAADADAPGGV
eukprot:EG_transcript_24